MIVARLIRTESNFTPAFACNQVEYLCLSKFGSLGDCRNEIRPRKDDRESRVEFQSDHVLVYLDQGAARGGRDAVSRRITARPGHTTPERAGRRRTGALYKVRTVPGDSQYSARTYSLEIRA